MNPIGNDEELDAARRFVTSQKLAVLSTVAAERVPQSALMGVAVTPTFELVFDTLRSSRKYGNLRANPAVALVIGCAGETSVQYEGVAEELSGEGLERYLALYLAAFPDGRERQSWPGITYFLVRPKWLRYCNYAERPPLIREFRF